MYKPVTYNELKLQKTLTNAIVGCHDLACNCPEPALHSIKLLATQLSKELTSTQKQQIKQCLGDTDTTGTADVPAIDFGEDLETIFADDAGEDAETG